ncbi:hypothetical protein F4212_14950 [Candidatus Poribacteria bacterium]|nr:hypothetical protein [Candidatus Poribacteria bacterium]
MKKPFLLLTILLVSEFCLQIVFAQYEPSTQLGLPEGAIARFGRGGIKEIMYSPDGTLFAVTISIGVWLYDARTGEEIKLLAGKHEHVIHSAAYSPDNKTIATGSWDGTGRLWDTRTGKNRKTLKGHTYGISSVAYSPDGKQSQPEAQTRH